MTAPVSRTTEQALRAAMERLLAGCPAKTDGRLTVVNLAIEAGVSRATANRANAVLADFRRAVASQRARGPIPEGACAGARKQSRNAHVLAQHIQARALYAKLQEQHANRANILPFRRTSHAHNGSDKKECETP